MAEHIKDAIAGALVLFSFAAFLFYRLDTADI